SILLSCSCALSAILAGIRLPLTAPSRILVVVRLGELTRSRFLPPNLLASPLWPESKVLVPLAEVPINGFHRLGNGLVVAIVDDGSRHPTEHRLDHVQELGTGREWDKLQLGNLLSCPIGAVVHCLHSGVEGMAVVPGTRIPRQVKLLTVRVLVQQA